MDPSSQPGKIVSGAVDPAARPDDEVSKLLSSFDLTRHRAREATSRTSVVVLSLLLACTLLYGASRVWDYTSAGAQSDA